MKRSLIAAGVLCGSIALAGGCQSDAGTGALIGAGVGALGGAIIGNNVGGHETTGALIGAAVGAGTGAAIGNASDQHKQERRDAYNRGYDDARRDYRQTPADRNDYDYDRRYR